MRFLRLSSRSEDNQAQYARDNQKDHGERACQTEILTVQMLVQMHDKCGSRIVRRTGTIGQYLRNIEHLETADHGSQQRVDHNGLQKREGNLPESLGRVRTVDLSRLKEGLVNALNTGHQHNHGVAKPHPNLDKHDNKARGPFSSR